MCNISHKFISLLMIFTIMVNIGVMPTYASENEYKTVYADNGFVRIEIEKDAVFTSGSHTFKFTPTKTGDYAFFFDKLSFDKEPEVVLSVSAGTLPVELEYKEDVAYYDATDETKNTVADGVYQYREGLSDYFVTGKSHICNIEPQNYYRVGDKLSMHVALTGGKEYTLALDVQGEFTMSSIDVRCLSIALDGRDYLLSTLDFADCQLLHSYGNSIYPLTYYMQWSRGSDSVEYFGNDFEIAGNYRNRNLKSAKTYVNPYVGGKMVYNIDVTVPGEYIFTAYIRSLKPLAPGNSIHDKEAEQNNVSGWWGVIQDGSENENNKWIVTELKNSTDKEAYSYATISRTFDLKEGLQNLVFRIDNSNVQVNYFKIDYKPYNEVKVDDSFSRFEFSSNGKVFLPGQTKTVWYVPEETGEYALYAGPVYNFTELTLNITDEDGNVVLNNTATSDLHSKALQRVEPQNFEPLSVHLKEGTKYSISLTASNMKDGSTSGSISYIDIRNLEIDIGLQQTMISMLDYTSVIQSKGDIIPNDTTEWNSTHKWTDIGLMPSGNYMSDRLSVKSEYATVIRNSVLGYTLNFRQGGRYKVTVFGSNCQDIPAGEKVTLHAEVSIDGQSCGKAMYSDFSVASELVPKNTLAVMGCPNLIDVESGTAVMTIAPSVGNKLDILGVKIERVESAVSLFYNDILWTDETTVITANVKALNSCTENFKLIAGQYDGDGRLINAEMFEGELLDNDVTPIEIKCEQNAKIITTFLWDSELVPQTKSETIQKADELILYVGNGGEYETLEAAFAAAKTAISERNVCIVLKGGEHIVEETIRLGEEFAGEHTLTVTSETVESIATISGGRHIDNKFEPHENGIYRVKVPAGYNSRQLFVNGIRATRARSDGKLTDCEKIKLSDGTWVTTTSYDLTDVTDPEVLELVYHEAWTSPRIMADSIRYDEELKKWLILFDGENASNWEEMIGAYKPLTTPDWIENSLALLDEPGEWYLDTEENYLYYMPRPFEDLDTAEIIMPVTERLFEAIGTYDKPIRNITFKNVRFADTTWLKPSTDRAMRSGQNELDKQISNTGELIDGAIEFTNAHNVNFIQCDFNHMGSIAIKMIGSVQNCNIEQNEFYDISASALAIGEVGYDENVRNPIEENCIKNITISNNYIRKLGVDYHSSAAIGLGYLKDSKISNNEICDGKYSGIHYGYGWQNTDPVITKNIVISNNYLHNLMNSEVNDGGAIYLLGTTNGDEGMNYVVGNYIEDMKNPSGCMYPDEGSCYWTFAENVIDEADFREYTQMNGLEWPNMKWLNAWSSSVHHIFANHNYSTFYNYRDGGYQTDITPASVYEDGIWPNEALNIILNAGINKKSNTLFDYGIQEINCVESYQLAAGETVDINLQALTSKDIEYDLSKAEIYSVSSNEGVVRTDGTTVTGISSGNAKVRIFVLTENGGRKELNEVCVDVTVVS